jgi:hypothetical protein
MKTKQSQKKTHRRGPLPNDTNYVDAYLAYLDTLANVANATFKAHIQIRLQIDRATVGKFAQNEFMHTLPHRNIINDIAGKDIYANQKNE